MRNGYFRKKKRKKKKDKNFGKEKKLNKLNTQYSETEIILFIFTVRKEKNKTFI
jgi:hypothetical protein